MGLAALRAFIPTGWLWPSVGMVALGLVAALTVQTVRVDRALRQVAEVRAACDRERAVAADTARQGEAAARAEERRIAQQHKESADALAIQLEAARQDLAGAAAASDRLRERTAGHVAAARQAARGPGTTGGIKAAGDSLGVLADVLGRADTRAGLLAAVADQARAAGLACERDYNALRAAP